MSVKKKITIFIKKYGYCMGLLGRICNVYPVYPVEHFVE